MWQKISKYVKKKNGACQGWSGCSSTVCICLVQKTEKYRFISFSHDRPRFCMPRFILYYFRDSAASFTVKIKRSSRVRCKIGQNSDYCTGGPFLIIQHQMQTNLCLNNYFSKFLLASLVYYSEPEYLVPNKWDLTS